MKIERRSLSAKNWQTLSLVQSQYIFIIFSRMSSLKVSTRVINYEMSNTICLQHIRCKQTFVEDWKSERRSLLYNKWLAPSITVISNWYLVGKFEPCGKKDPRFFFDFKPNLERCDFCVSKTEAKHCLTLKKKHN